MGTYLLKKYKHQFYHSRPNPYSGIPVKQSESAKESRQVIPKWKKMEIVEREYNPDDSITEAELELAMSKL
jgi:hypothetical protein